MRTLRTSPCLLMLPLCLVGCASTTGVATNSKMKTVASVGDKALPVVTGEPGASVVADAQAPERSRRPEGRISGRVVDENGDPLPDVRVRIAVGNASAGKAISSTTDRTGAFTLRGVRPGSAYTVIAEWEDGKEYLSGRSPVRAPDTDVRITLRPSDAETKGASAPIRPNHVSPVSEEETRPEEEVDTPRLSSRKPRVNLEDLPPAPEAEAFDPPARTRAPAAARPETPARGVQWRPVGPDGISKQVPRKSVEPDLGATSAPQDLEAREAGVIAATPLADDEGPNPLPPALEPAESSPPRDDVNPLPPAREPLRSSSSRDEVDPLPPARESRRPASSRNDDDPLPPAREPGQMSVSPRVRRKPPTPDPAPAETAPEPPLSEGNPLPPALEPAQESEPASAESSLPAPEMEPGRAPSSSPSSDSTFLPPVVEPDQPAKLATAPESSQEIPAATSPDLLSQSGAPSGLLGDLPAPVEAPPAESTAAPPTASEAAPAKDLAAASPFESSPFDPSPFEPTPTPATAPAPAPETAAVSEQSIFETGTATRTPNAEAESPPATRKRPTWKDLASLAPKASIPSGDAMDEVSKPASPPARPIARRSFATQSSARAAPPRAQVDVGGEFCDYDAKHRKINDFRLPDLEGRPVRFQDLDADLVLIDFWGTWCQPCLRSIPHLVELQKRMGASKFKVVGIACEQGPPAERAKKVAEQVRRLGINYPVLMSAMDGPSPLQDALKVQSYPTLILVDRQGRIVWQDKGATPVTLARLDRFLASASKPDTSRRY